MATKKTATKTSTKAKSNITVDLDDVKVSKSKQKKVVKAVKSAGAKAWILVFAFLFLGLGGGVFSCWMICRNDCFEIVGQEELVFTLDSEDERYVDEGVKIVSFGKDVSSSVEIETNLLVDDQGRYYAEEEGTYYIKYKSNDLKYGKIFTVEKVRIVTFVEPSEGGDANE